MSGYVLGPDADLDLDAIWEFIAAADRESSKLSSLVETRPDWRAFLQRYT